MENVKDLKKYFKYNLKSLKQIKQNFNEDVKKDYKFRRDFIYEYYSKLIDKIFLCLKKVSNIDYKPLFSISLEIL